MAYGGKVLLKLIRNCAGSGKMSKFSKDCLEIKNVPVKQASAAKQFKSSSKILAAKF